MTELVVRPMIHPNPGRLAFLAACALTLLPCAAQDGAGVTLRFVSFPRALDPKPVKLLVGEGKTLEVEIPGNQLSPPYKVPARDHWVLGDSVEEPGGQVVFKEFGKAKALASPSQLILLVRKGRDDAAGFEVIPLDNQDPRFGGGSFFFMNAAKVGVGGVVGDQKFALEPGRHIIIKPKADAAARTVQTTLFYRKDKETKPFFDTQWPLNDDARGLIFIYHDPDSARLRLHAIRDFP